MQHNAHINIECSRFPSLDDGGRDDPPALHGWPGRLALLDSRYRSEQALQQQTQYTY